MSRKILSFILALVLVLGCLPLAASAEEATGKCGENATWVYEDTTKTLTISGTGDMSGTSQNYYPWGQYKSSIEKVVIEDGITSISDAAFFRHENLENIRIPNSVTTMGECAFWGCKKLSHIVIPASVTEFKDSYLWYEGGFGQPVFLDCPLKSAGPIGSGCDIEFGWTEAIPDNAFCRAPIESITFPDGIRLIGEGAFAYSNFSRFEIPNSVTTIESAAFFGSNSLEEVVIPAQCIRIESNAFGRCLKLNRFEVSPENAVYSSHDGMLLNQAQTKLINCPYDKTSFDIPASVKIIGSGAFSKCKNMTNVAFPSGLQEIEGWAFSDCIGLTEAVIPSSVTKMGYDVFDGCTALSDLTLSGGVKSYYGNCLGEGNFKIVRISEGTTYIAGLFSELASLETVYLPASLAEIGNDTFKKCINLKNIVYSGTKTQWDQIKIAEGNQELNLIEITCTGTEPPTPPTPPTPIGPTDPEPTVETVTTESGNTATTTTQPDGGREIEVKTPSGEVVAKVDLPADPGEGKKFADVKPGAWFEAAVDKATAYGLFNGTSETQFNPNRPMTRGMLATVFYNLSGKSQYGVGEGAFADVTKDIWYEDAVDWAAKTGVTSGTSEKEFSPNRSITREQLVSMLYRYAMLIGADTKKTAGLEKFPDAGSVSGYAKEATQWAVAEGFISGRANGGKDYIAPQGTATRAEVAAVLTRFAEFLK